MLLAIVPGLLFGFGAFLFFLNCGKLLVEVTGGDGEVFCELQAVFFGFDSPTLTPETEEKLKAAIKTGIPEPLSTNDLLRALKRVKLSTKEWLQTARNHALYANEGGLYDDILKYMGIEK